MNYPCNQAGHDDDNLVIMIINGLFEISNQVTNPLS